MNFYLQQLSQPDLMALAASELPASIAARIEEDALPPSFVAARALELIADGHVSPWSSLFLIIRSRDDRIVGTCSFKTIPADRRVEVGYGVAPAAQGQGAATAALNLLITEAFNAGVTEVLAEVSPQNIASTRVVEKAGFAQVGARMDEDNEYVIQWLRQRSA
jgi:RimJ/RimL family protein N-acetyltransferase